ncbi:MAG: F0F1 ATP synthase subunit A [Rhodospirillales bacterium]|nr:F0F1 ATP synthase subunit A [Rhodospirillales bacterium]MDH3919165.1 F0F1 ATP synthase subunit A [Rhodospirillales bacterium]MDH3966972.1 F0F1 ATP synthase subunit A [Rhodospirillales bacterium]
MEANPLVPDILFHLGPVPISRPVLTTWAIMAVLTAVSWLGLRRASIHGNALQTVLEIVVETLEKQVSEIIRRDPWPYLPLLGTLFIFLVLANLSAVVPGMKPPTAHIETPAALAAIVFSSVHYFGIRSRGLAEYARRYTRPNLLLLPLNVLSEFTRTFSLMVRLFGNMMSHAFVIAIVVFMAGLFLPIPFMLLGILIGIIQAYIFTVLAAVYIGAAVGNVEAE